MVEADVVDGEGDEEVRSLAFEGITEPVVSLVTVVVVSSSAAEVLDIGSAVVVLGT